MRLRKIVFTGLLLCCLLPAALTVNAFAGGAGGESPRAFAYADDVRAAAAPVSEPDGSEPDDEFPWWAVIATVFAVAAVVCGVLTVILSRRKKNVSVLAKAAPLAKIAKSCLCAKTDACASCAEPASAPEPLAEAVSRGDSAGLLKTDSDVEKTQDKAEERAE